MTNKPCDRFEQLLHGEARGETLDPEQRRFVTDHQRSCADCSLMSETLDLARFDGACAPAPAQDDLARRRWIDAAVDQALATPKPAQRRRAASRRRVLIAASAAVLALVAGGVAVLAPTGVEEQASPRPAPMADLRGRLLLTAGRVHVSGEAASVGAELPAGTLIATGAGRTAIELDRGVRLLAGAGTLVQLTALSASAIESRLVEGRVVVHVHPERKGPPVAVVTRAGRVTVTGTAFAVDDDGQRVAVQVFRGRVRLLEDGAGERSVIVGRGAVFGETEDHELPADATAAALADLSALDLLTVEPAATLEVGSLPAGAQVTLDGIALGTAPLSASVRPGRRNLALFLAGYDGLTEELELIAGDRRSIERELAKTELADEAPAIDPAPRSPKTSGPKRTDATDPRADPSPVAHPGPEELLERAQTHRAARQWSAAAAAYRELIRLYPGRAEARSALVSLGNIELDHLRRPGAALRSFDSYLQIKQRGPLAQEAAFGRAVAFRALRNERAEVDALQLFLARFPNAIQAGQARERLGQLE